MCKKVGADTALGLRFISVGRGKKDELRWASLACSMPKASLRWERRSPERVSQVPFKSVSKDTAVRPSCASRHRIETLRPGTRTTFSVEPINGSPQRRPSMSIACRHRYVTPETWGR